MQRKDREFLTSAGRVHPRDDELTVEKGVEHMSSGSHQRFTWPIAASVCSSVKQVDTFSFGHLFPCATPLKATVKVPGTGRFLTQCHVPRTVYLSLFLPQRPRPDHPVFQPVFMITDNRYAVSKASPIPNCDISYRTVQCVLLFPAASR